jgi:anti-sigma B factor antagonist
MRDDGGVRILSLIGDLDLSGRDSLRGAIAEAASEGVKRLTIDLADLTFIDSTGIGELVRGRMTADEHTMRYLVVGAHGQVAEVLTVTGVIEYLCGGPTI